MKHIEIEIEIEIEITPPYPPQRGTVQVFKLRKIEFLRKKRRDLLAQGFFPFRLGSAGFPLRVPPFMLARARARQG